MTNQFLFYSSADLIINGKGDGNGGFIAFHDCGAAIQGMIRLQIEPCSSSISAFCSSSQSSAPSRKLILYSRPGCCLSDDLKEKLNCAFSLPSSAAFDSFSDINLHVLLLLAYGTRRWTEVGARPSLAPTPVVPALALGALQIKSELRDNGEATKSLIIISVRGC